MFPRAVPLHDRTKWQHAASRTTPVATTTVVGGTDTINYCDIRLSVCIGGRDHIYMRMNECIVTWMSAQGQPI